MTALVTGASSGIGKAFLPLFARDGHDLVLVARRTQALEEQKAILEKDYGISVHVVPLDLGKAGAAQQLHDKTTALGLSIDILVNNAGFGLYGEFHDVPLEKTMAMIQLNIVTLTELTHLYLDDMVKNHAGRILQVASTAAFQPGPRMAAYYATKSYVLSFSEAIAVELVNTGVTVTTLCPGPTKNEFNDVAGVHTSSLNAMAMMSSEAVAEVGYRALMRGERLAIAGIANRMAAVASQLSPRAAVLAVMGQLMKSRVK